MVQIAAGCSAAAGDAVEGVVERAAARPAEASEGGFVFCWSPVAML